MQVVEAEEFTLDTPITFDGKFVCQACGCPESLLCVAVYPEDGQLAALYSCPHIDIWLRRAELLMAVRKGVRH